MNWWIDLRFAVRMLRKKPGFTAVAVLSLSLGIGANTAVYNFIDRLLVRDLPVRHPHELVMVTSEAKRGQPPTFSYPAFLELRAQTNVFADLLACTALTVNSGNGDQPESLNALAVSANYFSLLGVRTLIGRAFLPEEDQIAGTHPVAVLSHARWQSQFGGDPDVIGRVLQLNDQSFTIVGVAPPEFSGTVPGFATDLYLPLTMLPALGPRQTSKAEQNPLLSRDRALVLLLGRLTPGLTRPQAEAALQVFSQQQQQIQPETKPARLLLAKGSQGHQVLAFNWTQPLMLAQLVMGLIWLIASVNVAHLMLAQGTVRASELAIRLALGASRQQISRQLITESLLLAGLSGTVGLLFAGWMSQALIALDPRLTGLPRALAEGLDGRGYIFAGLLTLVTGLGLGLLPAWQAAQPATLAQLRSGVAAITAPRHRWNLRRGLVVAQLALALVVLSCTGLCLQSLRRLQTVDLGFEASRVVFMPVELSRLGYQLGQSRAFYQQLTDRLKSLPGVESVSLTLHPPLEENGNWLPVSFAGRESPPGERILLRLNIVGPDYFRTLGLPLVCGRDFSEGDSRSFQAVIINEATARRYLPGQDPLGKRILFGAANSSTNAGWEIVGVVKDARYGRLSQAPEPMIFWPLTEPWRPDLVVQVRTQGEALALAATVRAETKALAPNLPLPTVRSLAQQKEAALYSARLAVIGLGLFGTLGLGLAAMGTFGMMAFWVNHRTREIGVRMALGAQARDVLRMVLAQGLWMALLGVGVGCLGGLAASRLLTNLLFGISPFDPLTFWLAAVILVAVTLLACWLPARRAARVDPIVALRYE